MSFWLTVPTIAEELGVNVDKVYGWIDAGELLAVNLAKSSRGSRPRLKVSRKALDDFLESRTTGKHTSPPKRRPTRAPQEDFVEYY
ncbi:MAG: helix-turn-helix domain-containing protein [Pirellulaceae bacterium]